MKYIKKYFLILSGLIGPVAIACYPGVFLYSQNVLEMTMDSVLPVSGFFVLLACGIYVVFGVLTRSIERACFNSCILMFFVMNFKKLENGLQWIFPAVKYWHVLTVVFAIAIFTFVTARNKEILSQINKVITIVFCGLLLWNVIPKMPQIIAQNRKDIQEQSGRESLISAGKDMPNIYHLVFDEYSSNDFMKKYYDYDNSEFTDYLEELGFNVSYSSYNEAFATQICMTNTLNMDFLFDMEMNSDAEKAAEMKEKRIHNRVFEILKENGYTIQGIGDPEFYGLPRIEGGGALQHTTAGGKSVPQLLNSNTVFYPFYVYNTSDRFQSIQASVQFLKKMDKQSDNPVYTLFHVGISHTPFVVDGNGNPIPGEHSSDWKNKKYYKGTFIYCTTVMKDLVENIIKEDPDSIILLTSDHSARASSSDFDSMFEDIDKCEIFNALYYQKNKVDIEGLTEINTMRKIFNKLFDQNYEMIKTYPLMKLGEYIDDK